MLEVTDKVGVLLLLAGALSSGKPDLLEGQYRT
jgi:hypothetical protein